MNQMNIPTNAYIFIGVASLVMAAVTIMDKGESNEPVKTEEGSSFTDMLPSFGSPSDIRENSVASTDTNYNPFDMNLNSDTPPSSSEPVMATNFNMDPMFNSQSTQNNDMFSSGLNSDMPPQSNEPSLTNPFDTPLPSAPENNMAFNTDLNADMPPPSNEPFVANPGFDNTMGNQQQPGQQSFFGGNNKTKHKKIEHKKQNKHKKTKRYTSK
jgi:hypothetical protein